MTFFLFVFTREIRLLLLGHKRAEGAQVASISEGGGPLAGEGAVPYLRLARSFVVSDCAADFVFPKRPF